MEGKHAYRLLLPMAMQKITGFNQDFASEHKTI